MKHVMIDLETLGTSADSVIMSFGAVRFDSESGEMDDEAFYRSISIESNLEKGRRIDESTLIWWMDQSAAAKKVFTEPKVSLEEALTEFYDWVGTDKNTYVWSNGADFDIPMLHHAVKSFGWELPWNFWNNRCFRTLKNLPAAKRAAKPEAAVKHNALSDAIAQAKHAQLIWAELTKK